MTTRPIHRRRFIGSVLRAATLARMTLIPATTAPTVPVAPAEAAVRRLQQNRAMARERPAMD